MSRSFQFITSRVPSTLPHLPPFSGVTWLKYAVKLRFCDGLETPPRNLGLPVAIGGPGGTYGGGGGTVVPGSPLSRSNTVKKTPCWPKANLSSHSPSSRPATWNVWVRLPAVTGNPATGGSPPSNADSFTHFQTWLCAMPPPATLSLGSVKPTGAARPLARIQSRSETGFFAPKPLP